MKILFYTTCRDLKTGSYRIWINDLNQYFNECGIKSDIADRNTDINNYDVIICGKPDVASTINIKKKYPNKKVGIINLSADKKNLPIDFVIVGSIEEKDSLSHYDNVFLFPLIEKMYQNSDLKIHTKKDKLRLGFHGHYPHLSKFEPGLKLAIENIDKIYDVELLVITSNKNYNWKYGRPNIDNIILKGWDLLTIKKDLASCDIGLVPNVTYIPFCDKKFPISVDKGLYKTDHIMRMKNKSNAGRAFVFHQLGIPVVADFTPSNFHILGDSRNGYLAHNSKTWERSILELFDHEKRQKMAKSAKREFDRLYDPLEWARRLYYNIGRI